MDATFTNPIAHSHDPGTSHRAAARAEKFRSTHAERVYQAIAATQGRTAPELAQALKMGEYQVRRRLTDLRQAGRIVARGERDGNGCWWLV